MSKRDAYSASGKPLHPERLFVFQTLEESSAEQKQFLTTEYPARHSRNQNSYF
jgi:hypothetical protein